MATCRCGTVLPGRQQKCADCKANPGHATQSPPAPSDATPDGLHDRGSALWEVLGQKIDTMAGQIALEACRTADRLDDLDRVIQGKGVLRLLQFRVRADWTDEDGNRDVRVAVVFDQILAEARQQQATFAKLLSDVGAPAVPLPQPKAKNPLDELRAKREARG